MPYRKRRYKKRGKYLKKQVYKNKKKLKLLARAIEYKYFDTVTAADGWDATGNSLVLNAMQLGNTAITRVGNKVVARRLTIRGYLQNTNGEPLDGIARMIIVKARDQNNNQQSLALLQQDGTDVNSMIYDAHKHRYQVLCDSII